MPKIIPYEQVLRRMTEQGFVSLYHNSGAFGFASSGKPQAVGWIVRMISPSKENLVKRVD